MAIGQRTKLNRNWRHDVALLTGNWTEDVGNEDFDEGLVEGVVRLPDELLHALELADADEALLTQALVYVTVTATRRESVDGIQHRREDAKTAWTTS